MERMVGDHPEPMVGPFGTREHDRRLARADDLDDLRQAAASALVEEPERLEACLGRAQEGEAVLFGPAVGLFMWQHDPVLVRLQAQGGDHVAPAAAVKSNLMHIHRRRVGGEDASHEPFLKGACRAVVVAARPPDPYDFLRRNPLVPSAPTPANTPIRTAYDQP